MSILEEKLKDKPEEEIESYIQLMIASKALQEDILRLGRRSIPLVEAAGFLVDKYFSDLTPEEMEQVVKERLQRKPHSPGGVLGRVIDLEDAPLEVQEAIKQLFGDA